MTHSDKETFPHLLQASTALGCMQGAIVTMTKALAKDLIQKKGIRVNAGKLVFSTSFSSEDWTRVTVVSFVSIIA